MEFFTRALQRNQVQNVKKSLKKGQVDPNQLVSIRRGREDDDDYFPLYFCCSQNFVEMAKLLLQHSADPNLHDEDFVDGRSPIHAAVDECLQMLLACDNIKVNQQNNGGWTALHFAVTNDNTDTVEMLIDRVGIDVNVKDKRGMTPLHVAVQNSNALHLLLECDEIDVNVQCLDGKTPLHFAVGGNHLEAVKMLVDYSIIDVTKQDNEGMTALHMATFGRKDKVARILVNHTASNLGLRNSQGQTALHCAVINSQPVTVGLLMELSDPDIVEDIKETLMSSCKSKKILSLFKD